MRRTVSMCILILMTWGTTAAAISDADKCEAAKNTIAGKYAFCRQKAEAKAVKTGDPADYSKCDTNFSGKWATAETNGGGMCPTDGDAANVQSYVAADANLIALKLTGVRFVDNGDGTITDTQTSLMWEKKDDAELVHDKDNRYSWATIGEFVSEVNGYSAAGTAQAGLGGHSDWRMPTSAELQTILLEPVPCGTIPCIDSIFGPTVASLYWSSTTYSGDPTTGAFIVHFNGGNVFSVSKLYFYYVRAVRGGL